MQPEPEPSRDVLWRPSLIVFISNACIMILELVAGRLLAPNIGVSLYTWTSIIGVIFAGMSAGNYLGGRLADRHASRRTLGLLFMLAGLGSLGVVGLSALLGNRPISVIPGLPLLVPMLLFVMLIFFLPSVLLGMISPFVIKLAVRDLTKSGNVVGRIYAASALGSILGTFATGYVLVFYFGVRAILIFVGLMLIVLGALIGDWRKRRVAAAASAEAAPPEAVAA